MDVNIKNMDKDKRIVWIDMVRGIAMIMVIYGHCDGTSMLRRYIYMFHVPLFFFISGYLFSENKSIREFLSSRLKRLLLPFVLFGVTIILLHWFVSVLIGTSYDVFYYIKCMFLQVRNTEARIWFIPCLFLAEVLLFIGLKIKSIWGRCGYFGLIIMLGWLNVFFGKYNFPWYPDTAAIAVSIMLIGFIAKKYKLIEKIAPAKELAVGGILSVIVFGLDIRNNVYIDMIQNVYGNILLFYFGVISGVLLLIGIGRLWLNKFIVYIGRNTITFLCLNSIAAKVGWRVWLSVKNVVSIEFSNAVVDGIFVTAFSIILLTLSSAIINSYLPFYIGRISKKREN